MLKTLQQTQMRAKPFTHHFMGKVFFPLDLSFPRKTEIVVTGWENIPKGETVFFALNHTDSYTCWPLQYEMYRRGDLPYTAVWVKAKYYQHPILGRALHWINNIPVPSRSYLLAAMYRQLMEALPSSEDYQLLRAVSEGGWGALKNRQWPQTQAAEFARRYAGGDADSVRDQLEAQWDLLAQEVVRINRDALHQANRSVVIFPQGTRSIRLLPALPGLAQMAQHLKATIVPVGCSGLDRIYQELRPFSAGGRVVYRIGRPIPYDDPAFGANRVTAPFTPLTRSAEAYATQFRAIGSVITQRINELLDPEYQLCPEGLQTRSTDLHRHI